MPQQASQGNAPIEDGPWAKGADSYLEPTQVQKGFYRWGVNISNRGGVVRTRPGYSVIPVQVTPHNQHASVVALAGANRALTGEQLIDGNVQTNRSRIALVRQTDPTQNGIWITSSGAWHRAADANNGNNIQGQFFVGTGQLHAGETWMLNTPPPITLGQTPLTYTLSPTPQLPPVPLYGRPRGITTYEDNDGVVNLVVAIGSQILFTPYPFTDPFTPIQNLSFVGVETPVVFTRCIVSVTEADDGTITEIDPYPILMIQDGISRAGYWKSAQDARHLDPSKKIPYGGPSETPIGLWAAWSGNRYWVSNGARIRASNLLNPIKFTEEDILEEGGFLTFPGPITGVTNTFDFTSLLVYTDVTTSTLASSLIDRTQWGITPGFQKVIFDGIGCAGGNAIATQWGMKWWYTHDGLMALDEGLRAYQSSKVTFRDREMAWSKANISTGFEDSICMGSFENLLFVSVPSGDKWNAHTWVMDEAPLDQLTYWGYFGLPSWAGIWEGVRPVAWTTAHIMGHKRTFCLSQDYPINPDPNANIGQGNGIGQNNVWEMVTATRVDQSLDQNNNTILKPIKCSLETKLLGYDGNYKFFRFAEIYLDNVEGEVDLTVSYAPRRGGYKQILQKHIVSSDWLLQNPQSNIIKVNTFIFDPQRPQSRVVRTISEAKTFGGGAGPSLPAGVTPDDLYQNVQTSGMVPFPRQKDYAFSVLLEWTGRLSISSVRAYFDPEEQETEGIDELDEGTNRFVDMRGLGLIDTRLTPYVLDPLAMDFRSHVITQNSPVWIDPIYTSE